jgi:hypothetical protein
LRTYEIAKVYLVKFSSPHQIRYNSSQNIAYHVTGGAPTIKTSMPQAIPRDHRNSLSISPPTEIMAESLLTPPSLPTTLPNARSDVVRSGFGEDPVQPLKGDHLICFGTLRLRTEALVAIGGITSLLTGVEAYYWITRTINQGSMGKTSKNRYIATPIVQSSFSVV